MGYESERSRLAEEAIRLLDEMPFPSLYQRFKNSIRKNLMHQLVAPPDRMSWPVGCLVEGLLADGRSDALERCRKLMQDWIKQNAPIYTVDDLLACRNYASFWQERGQRGDLSGAVALQDFLEEHPADGEGSLPYRPAHGDGKVYADGIGMILPCAWNLEATDYPTYGKELALRQIDNFYANGIDLETGLPWHAYSLTEEGRETFGELGWGRAVGWIAYGLAACVEAINSEDTNAVMAKQQMEEGKKREAELSHEMLEYAKLFEKTVLCYLRPNALVGSRVGDPESPVDTSASAMVLLFLLAMGKKDLVQMGIDSLMDYYNDGKVLQAQGECMGLGQYSEKYGSYPWSVGPVLQLLAKWDKLSK